VNVLKPHLRTTIETLLAREVSQRQIARQTGVDRKTIRAYARAFAAARASAVANSPGVATGSPGADTQIPPPRPPGSPPSIAVSPAVSPSACQPHRAWIEEQLALGRNAVAIYQDLVDQHGFAAGYNSVKRFVAKLRAREPDRFDVLEFLPAEEAQVDWGTGRTHVGQTGRARPEGRVSATRALRPHPPLLGESVPEGRLEGR
jgi:transposase